MKPFQLLIKPAGPDCNLRCAYCFYRRAGDIFPGRPVHRMGRDVLEEMTRQYLALGLPASCFTWQGGEPTLCGLPFFEEAVRLQMKHGGPGQVVCNAIQTNGLLIDEDWCRFLKKYRFLVGLSLDGPRDIHDRHRRGNGEGSWEGAMRAAEMLAKAGVPFNVLAMVTRESEGRARALFAWFADRGFRFLQFIPCLERSEGGGVAPFSVSDGGYGDFLCDLFDAWWENRGLGVSIRLFDALLEQLIGGRTGLCLFSSSCGGYVVVEHDGTVYPCDFFVTRGNRLGNLMKVRLGTLYVSGACVDFAREKSLLPGTCHACRWLPLCHGGCRKDRIDEGGRPASRSHFCHAYRRFFRHAIPRLRSLAEEIRQAGAPPRAGDQTEPGKLIHAR